MNSDVIFWLDALFLLYIYFTFYNCIVPLGFLPCEIGVAFPEKSQLRQSRYPTYGACWVF